MTAGNIFWVISAATIFLHGPCCSHHYQSDLLGGFFSPPWMSTHTACYNRDNLNKWSHRPPKHVFLHMIWRRYPHHTPTSKAEAATHTLPSPSSSSPVFPGDLPRLRGQDRTGEDKLQPQSRGYLSCFHLHQQLISHHWRALACQAEDFIRDVLYGP